MVEIIIARRRGLQTVSKLQQRKLYDDWNYIGGTDNPCIGRDWLLIVVSGWLWWHIIVGVFVIGIYNKLVTMRNRYKNAYAQIDVQLKRRYDLIPNLVETAKGYIEHERETLEAVTAARNIAYAASKAAAANPGDASAMKNLDRGGNRPRRHVEPADDGERTISRPEGEPEHDAAHRGTDLDGK